MDDAGALAMKLRETRERLGDYGYFAEEMSQAADELERLAAEIKRLGPRETEAKDDDENFAARALKEAATRGKTFIVESEGGDYMARIHSDVMMSILSRANVITNELDDAAKHSQEKE